MIFEKNSFYDLERIIYYIETRLPAIKEPSKIFHFQIFLKTLTCTMTTIVLALIEKNGFNENYI